MRALLLALGLSIGCFDPSYSDATRCGPGGECPSGRACAPSGFCLRGDLSPDAFVPGPDARQPDAPPPPPPDAPPPEIDAPPPDAPPEIDAAPPDAPPPIDAPPPDAPPPPDAGLIELTVEKAEGATGLGTVSSEPAGLLCDGACTAAAASFARGTKVNLEAKPSPGSHFAGWAGDCQGSYRNCAVFLDAPGKAIARFTRTNANIIFVTSLTYPATFGGIAKADAECRRLADGAGLVYEWKALLSDSAIDARSRLVLPAGSSVPSRGFIRLDDKPVSDTVTDLFDNERILYPVIHDENGQEVSFSRDNGVWTGSRSNGRFSSFTCADWSSTAGSASVGRVGGGPYLWMEPQASCMSQNRLYCVTSNFNTAVSAPAPAMGKRIWRTMPGFMPGNGPTPATSLCDSQKPAGVVTARPLLATLMLAPASNLDPLATYVRLDGIAVGTGAEIIASSDNAMMRPLASGVWQRADGSYGGLAVWTGSARMDAMGTDASTCGNWLRTTGVGTAGAAGVASWWDGGSGVCNGLYSVMCVEK